MKNTHLLFLMLIIFMASSCTAWKTTLSSKGNMDAAIDNSIADFINTSKLFKADSVFDIAITDKDDYYIIGIGGAVNKIYPYLRDTIGAKNDLFPTKFLIRKGKLFYWNDPEQEITQEIIDVLSRYDAIDLDWRDREYNIPLNIHDGDLGVIYIPPLMIDDGYEAIIYYVCKNNFKNYKKKKADNILRHYRTPKLKCK